MLKGNLVFGMKWTILLYDAYYSVMNSRIVQGNQFSDNKIHDMQML